MIATLDKQELKSLDRHGYIVLDSWLPSYWSSQLEERLSFFASRWPSRKALIPDPIFENFCVSDEVLTLALALLGETCLFHHASGRISHGTEPKPWHHDRDGPILPHATRPRMFHFFFYPRGLCSDCAPLVIKPGTHLHQVSRGAPRYLGTKQAPDDAVIRGGPGLTVVADSAVWHMRPPSTGRGERFDLNISFVEDSDIWAERLELAEVLDEVAHRRGGRWLRYFRPQRSRA